LLKRKKRFFGFASMLFAHQASTSRVNNWQLLLASGNQYLKRPSIRAGREFIQAPNTVFAWERSEKLWGERSIYLAAPFVEAR
jgi:hypothetical protein